MLSIENFVNCDYYLKDGYILEKVSMSSLKENALENSETIIEILTENWGNEENFKKYGTGYLVRNENIIVSWVLSDCSFQKTIAIGVHTDERYRSNGFAKIAASATIKDCFAKGYKKIDWLCVDSNKGSIAIAESLGFKLINIYYSFTSYPPIENLKDLSEHEWRQWGEYLEEASKTEERLLLECLYAYIKSNDVKKTIDIMKYITQKNIKLDYLRFKNWIINLQSYNMCSNFTNKDWIEFLNKNITSIE